MRYLDPKADLTFKKVFGEHPDLVISLLNALLPFEKPEEEIAEIEYLTPELVPETPLKKNSIVDVRCKDKMGRQFLVEMQMLWSPAFMQRVLFNASKAYVRQLGGRESKYELLQPVYSLNLVNDIFLPDVPEAYHDYKIVQVEHTDKVIEGLRFIFVELPKFKPQDFKGKKMAVLWLRYLTEIDEHTRQAPKELLENPEINKAVTQIEESAFNDAQLWWYDDFWDAVRVENTLISDALREGRQKGMEEGRQEGIQEGIRQNNIQNARGMKAEGIPTGTIAKITGLSPDEIEKL
ncbi:Rpn family recombination-promoting nuclease/putative transposase [Bacteroides gallinaceum]|uniref:Rpn family recombination-promoting nuclease/putative transposase n=1 Tax=Bacteroides gallinaceum TaxID=1462571 RepID=A0ABT7X6S3_9BACE|nr:Rpn family recombination-promoting nuclease/putative transposase [Bacteroides gallinaceum]MDN0049783.1 Rpn family recombination-promoting nuclease/putative transposase [Bacteroides gallinaceum]